MDRAVFKTLREEVSAITTGGYHDGISTHIFLKHGLDPLVNHHEGIHDEIFGTCPDQQILSTILLWEAGEFASLENKEDSSNYSSLASLMLESSEFAHEVFATYLSVKQFSPEQQTEQILRHPQHYQNFYRYLSETLDGNINSSYLQYGVAQALMVLTFSTPFARRFLTSLPLVITTLAEEENPSFRLRRMTEILKREGKVFILLDEMQKIADSTASENGFLAWSLQSEVGWETADQQNRQLVEYAVINYTFKWLSDESGLELCDFTEEDIEIYEKFCLLTGREKKFVAADRSLSARKGVRKVAALRAGRTKIRNERSPEYIDPASLLHFLEAGVDVIGMGSAGGNEDELHFVALRYGNPIDVACFKFPTKSHTVFTDPEQGVDIMPQIDLIVLGIHNQKKMKDWQRVLPEFTVPWARNSVLRAARRIKFMTFWYLHGSYVDWISTLRKPLRLIFIQFSIGEKGGGFGVFLRHSFDDHACYMRILSWGAFSELLPFLDELVDDGSLVPETDVQGLRDLYASAINFCRMTLVEF